MEQQLNKKINPTITLTNENKLATIKKIFNKVLSLSIKPPSF